MVIETSIMWKGVKILTNVLPYQIRKTASKIFAGKTGFSMAEMEDFFREEIQRRMPPPRYPSAGGGILPALGFLAETVGYGQNLRQRETAEGRRAAFESWLQALPIEEQVDLLLMLCREPYFPMRFGTPSDAERKRMAALLDEFAIDASVTPALQRLDSISLMRTWEKAMDRCERDPAGAITAARALLEGVCKHLLDECSVSHGENDDLPKLYGFLVQKLQIAPAQQGNEALRQAFGGCYSVLNGLTALRNHLGDAHGQGKDNVEPTPAQAKLAVNLAGSLVQFLIQMWEIYQQEKTPATEAGD